jgi:diphosphomevalonate decarboxylase
MQKEAFRLTMPSESIQQSTLSNAAFGRAPANIALIKYMGKSDPSLNQPANSSLSLTLHSLCTVVEALWVIPQDPSFIKWIPELPRVSLEKAQLPSPWSLEVPSLTTQNINRTLQHSKKAVAFARAHLPQHGFEVHEKSFFEKNQLEIRSANTFPPSTGIASSASSFAALTLAVCF